VFAFADIPSAAAAAAAAASEGGGGGGDDDAPHIDPLDLIGFPRLPDALEV
jgi:hypothetical protein